MKAAFYNRLWLIAQYRDAWLFHRNMYKAHRVQEKIWQNYLNRNKNTRYGKMFYFDKIKSYEDFVKFIPIIEDYSQLDNFIEAIRNGERDVLFAGITDSFETTSGTTSPVKYIPYNGPLKREFQRAVGAWMWNIYRTNAGVFDGPAYWSLSPPLKKKFNDGMADNKMLEDTEYFSGLSAFLLRKIFAVSPHLSRITNAHLFYVKTWQDLLQKRDLTFISCWSPVFLVRLIEFLKNNAQEILKGMKLEANKKIEIVDLLCTGPDVLKKIFPRLQLISCWTHGQSSLWKKELHELSGNIPIQGKGLLLTEGVVTIPAGDDKYFPAYYSHFYEFRDKEGSIYRMHELAKGGEYEVIITTGGGLYRYNTHDTVNCRGIFGKMPDLIFVGRSDKTSDLVGEKLSEMAISGILEDLMNRFPGIKFACLSALKNGHLAAYQLITECEDESQANRFLEILEHELLKNPYYFQAIASGQLEKMSLIKVGPSFKNNIFELYKKRKNIRDGDIKLPVIFEPGWLDELIKADTIVSQRP